MAGGAVRTHWVTLVRASVVASMTYMEPPSVATFAETKRRAWLAPWEHGVPCTDYGPPDGTVPPSYLSWPQCSTVIYQLTNIIIMVWFGNGPNSEILWDTGNAVSSETVQSGKLYGIRGVAGSWTWSHSRTFGAPFLEGMNQQSLR